ncbi:hypothetical protein [Micromonospora sp. NPDC047730]|uniref:hypothetical protein n=1 Tax=Micromonospora sp. NPDC047730 TaxID=3364253 RepID=UPI00371A2D13
MEREPRRWRMYAGRLKSPVEGREFMNFGDPWYVRAYGREPVPVELTEDPEGTYWGWIDAPGHPQADGMPEMVQPHYGMFTMQFPYGPEAEQERGKGEIVRMSVREVSE